MDHSKHFQLCIKLDPLPKYGLLTVSNKQLVIASMSSARRSSMQQRDTSCKQKTFLCLCLFNEQKGWEEEIKLERIREWQERTGGGCSLLRPSDWSWCQQCPSINCFKMYTIICCFFWEQLWRLWSQKQYWQASNTSLCYPKFKVIPVSPVCSRNLLILLHAAEHWKSPPPSFPGDRRSLQPRLLRHKY